MMPPSGFTSKAIAGSVIAIRSVYSGLYLKVLSGEYKTLEEAIEGELSKIEARLKEPSTGFLDDVAKGFMVFIKTCLEDLLVELRDGKHESPLAALEYEVRNITKALEKLHIDSEGNFMERQAA